MISIQENTKTIITPTETRMLVEIRGLSTDEKPTEMYDKKIENGSTFIEIDTGKIYFYDLENQQWMEV